MRIAKIILSLLALVAAGAAGVTELGPFKIDPAVTELLVAIGGALSLFGITPVPVPPAIAKALGALSVVLVAVVAQHAARTMGVVGIHEWLYKVLGAFAIILGLASRVPSMAASPATPPPAPNP